MKKKEEKNEVEMLEEKDSNEVQKGLVEEEKKDVKVKDKTSKSKKTKIILVVSLLIIVIGGLASFIILKDKFINSNEVEKPNKEYKSDYKLSGNSLENFDLYFLQAENNSKNMVYSPLSIKYALAMLSEGAAGNTKAQIDSVIGEYKANKYTNSANMSFANAMFIRNSFKKSVKSDYVNNLINKFMRFFINCL